MKKLRENLYFLKWFLVGIPIFLYGLSERHGIGLIEQQYMIKGNIWDVILGSLNDIYLIIYYILPLIILISSINIDNTFEYTKLIRQGSYKKWIFAKMRELIKIDILYLGVVTMSLVFAAIGKQISLSWSEIGSLNLNGNEILFTLRSFIIQPVFAYILQISLFLLCLICIQLLMCIIYGKTKNQLSLHMINAGIFLFASISFKLLPPDFYRISLVNYLSLFHGLAGFGSFLPFIILLFVLAILLASTNLVDKDLRKTFNQTDKIPYIIYFILCILSILFSLNRYHHSGMDLWEVFIGAFYGSTNEAFSIRAFTSYIIIYFGGLYLIQMAIHTYLSDLSYFSMIRHGSINKWLMSWLLKIIINIFIVLLGLLATTIGLAYLFQYRDQNMISVGQIIYQFMVNGFLQMLVCVVFVILVSYLTEDVFKSLLYLLALTIFMFPGFRIFEYIPIGLNSMSFILEDTSLVAITGSLTITIAIEVTILLYVLNKKDYTL